MAERDDITLKKQQAAEAMQRARQAQLENARMQRELQAAARELAKRQAEAEKAREALMRKTNAARANTMQAGAAQPGVAKAGSSQPGVQSGMPRTGSPQPGMQSGMAQTEISQEEYWAGGRKAAEQRAAQQRAILQAAERRALKKQAAEEAAALVARQKAQEAKKHHTSPETRQLQDLLLQQIADIMKDEEEVSTETEVSAAAEARTDISDAGKRDESVLKASEMGDETFGDLVFLDSDGNETKPEPPDIMKKTLQDLDVSEEEYSLNETGIQKWGNLGQWFQTVCWMHIPVFGFWYMVIVAIRRKTPKEKKMFARAYILFRILVLTLALTILYVFYKMGISFVEQILTYIEAHL